MSFTINKYRVEGWHKDGYNVSVIIQSNIWDLNTMIEKKGIVEIYRVVLVSRGDSNRD